MAEGANRPHRMPSASQAAGQGARAKREDRVRGTARSPPGTSRPSSGRRPHTCERNPQRTTPARPTRDPRWHALRQTWPKTCAGIAAHLRVRARASSFEDPHDVDHGQVQGAKRWSLILVYRSRCYVECVPKLCCNLTRNHVIFVVIDYEI